MTLGKLHMFRKDIQNRTNNMEIIMKKSKKNPKFWFNTRPKKMRSFRHPSTIHDKE